MDSQDPVHLAQKPWNLTEHQQLRLSQLQHLNLKIKRAHLLKEAFREFWDYVRPTWAERYLGQWFWWVRRIPG